MALRKFREEVEAALGVGERGERAEESRERFCFQIHRRIFTNAVPLVIAFSEGAFSEGAFSEGASSAQAFRKA